MREIAVATAIAHHAPADIDKTFVDAPLPQALDESVQRFITAGRKEGAD